MRIDNLDRAIIASLSEDSRRSFHRIGAEVGLSAPAVKRRVDRLISDGVIEQFTVVVSPDALGHKIEAFVQLYCEGRVAPARIQAMVADLPEVASAYTVTGDADALIQVYADDMHHFEQTLERIREQPGVSQTQSIIVLSRL